MIPVSSWPLDGHLLIGLQRTRGDGRVQTTMEAGPPYQRRRFTAVVDRMDGELILDTADYELLSDWGELALEGWSLSFTWKDPLTGENREMQWRDPPHATMLASDEGRWRVVVALAVLP